MTRRLAVFDCDGTLVDSQANIVRAMEAAFAAHRLKPPDRHAIRRITGLSLVEAMRVLIPAGDAALHVALADSYKRAFQALRSNGGLADEPLFPGVRDGLQHLADSGWLLGVATGKSDRGLGLCLAHHDIAAHFVTLQTADRHPSKPHPAMLIEAMAEAGVDPGSTAMIGDTTYDMLMAAAAGARPVGVDWGYHGIDELTATGAVGIAADMAGLIALLEDMP